MKKFIIAMCITLSYTLIAQAQGIQLNRETQKMYKTKIKEYKKEGWKITGTSKTIQVALMSHYQQLNDPNNRELVGEVSQCQSLNVCKQAAYNNALVMYANLAGSTLRGRVVADLNVDQSRPDAEFDKMYAAYERLVEQEIKGVLTESFAIERMGKNGRAYKVFFIVNEEKAMSARLRALERAFKESEAAQKYANKISDFVRKGLEQK